MGRKVREGYHAGETRARALRLPRDERRDARVTNTRTNERKRRIYVARVPHKQGELPRVGRTPAGESQQSSFPAVVSKPVPLAVVSLDSR